MLAAPSPRFATLANDAPVRQAAARLVRQLPCVVQATPQGPWAPIPTAVALLHHLRHRRPVRVWQPIPDAPHWVLLQVPPGREATAARWLARETAVWWPRAVVYHVDAADMPWPAVTESIQLRTLHPGLLWAAVPDPLPAGCRDPWDWVARLRLPNGVDRFHLVRTVLQPRGADAPPGCTRAVLEAFADPGAAPATVQPGDPVVVRRGGDQGRLGWLHYGDPEWDGAWVIWPGDPRPAWVFWHVLAPARFAPHALSPSRPAAGAAKSGACGTTTGRRSGCGGEPRGRCSASPPRAGPCRVPRQFPGPVLPHAPPLGR